MSFLRASLLLAGSLATAACNSSPAAPSCTDQTSQAQSATSLAEAEAGVDLSCTVDSDCVDAPNSTTCFLSCGVVLTQAGAAQLGAAIARINATTCANFVADGCQPNPAPPCIGLGAYCVKGQCQGLPGPPSNDAGAGPSDAGAADASDATAE